MTAHDCVERSTRGFRRPSCWNTWSRTRGFAGPVITGTAGGIERSGSRRTSGIGVDTTIA